MSYLVNTTNDLEFLPTEHHGRRWRMAFRAINFTRFLDSLCKKVFEEQTKLLPSVSRVAIKVNDDIDHVPLININIDDDQKILITQMAKKKNCDSLNQLGGAKQVVALVQSDLNKGISGSEADLAYRRNFFGANRCQKLPLRPKSFFWFVLEALHKDQTIIIDLVFSIISLSFGAWYDGGSNVIAIFLVVVVSSFINFKHCTQLGKLLFDDKYSSEMKKVQVIRDGNHQHISKIDIVVGDIVFLNTGDQIPADGLFLKDFSLKVYESSFRGENYHVEINCTTNPFLLSGAEVTDGSGFMLVTAVGMNTYWGDHQLMDTMNLELEQNTPLQARLHKLVSCVAKFGLSVAMLIFTFSMIHYFAGNTRDQFGRKTKVKDLLNSILRLIGTSVNIVMMATPQCLPLAVTSYLAYSVKPMMKNEKATLRKLSACETMASVTTICTGKTGILTWNHMEVKEFWLGKNHLTEDETSMGMLDPQVSELLQEGAVLNSSIVYVNDLLPRWSGANPAEEAIISWAVSRLSVDFNEIKQRCEIIHVQAFNFKKQTSGVMTRKSNEKAIHTHWKGDAEKILAMCSTYYVKNGGALVDMDEEERKEFEAIIRNMEVKGLRCFALAHKICKVAEEENHEKKLEETGFALLGLLGLKNPCRPGARAAVESCNNAKVNVKMITGDNSQTARAIALECGILDVDLEMDDLDKAVVEGVEFRNYSADERMARIDDIRVMARSSPSDKFLMVQCLKEKGHVVAVTGDGTNDARALEKADIGLCMGIQGTDLAKKSSDMVILDDNFNSIVTVFRWGRCGYNNIQKLIQFQLTFIVAALVINFVAAIFSGEVPLTSVQLLWVNLIMDTMGTLALATMQPTDDDLMTKPPVGRSEPLITKNMWRNLIAQVLCQVAILLALQFKAKSIFGVNENVKNTIIFNTLVFFQVFNEFNARKLEKKNIFEGIFKNKLFLAITGFCIIVQVAMMELLGKISGSQRLNCGQWGACVAIAAISLPVDYLVKCIN